MNTSEPPHRHHGGLEPRLPPTRLPFPGSPPAGGWSTLPVAERLIQALERLIDLNEETARLTALYRANLPPQSPAVRSADSNRIRFDCRDRGTRDNRRESER